MSASMTVTFFPSCLQGISSRSVEKSSRNLGAACFVVISLLGTLSAGRYWTWKEGRNRREEDSEGEGAEVLYWWSHGRTGLV